MIKISFICSLVLSSFVLSAPSSNLEEQDPTSPFELVAYNIEPDYLKLFYADGLAYAGNYSSWSGNLTTDVTFTIKDGQLVATASTPGVTLDEDTILYIQTTENEALPLGFTGNSIDTPPDAVTEGFGLYDKYLIWEGSHGPATLFRLNETEVSGVYQFFWDTSNIYASSFYTPVMEALL